MKRLSIMLYSFINYGFGVAALVYLIAFIFNLFVPVSIDSGESANNGTALLVNLGLISLFGLQHSIMARPRFKAWLTRVVPQAAERSTYMFATGVVVFALCLLWQPMPTLVWEATSDAAYYGLLATGLAGWGLVLFSTFLINHFDLFGLRQAWLNLLGKPYTHLPFKMVSLYKHIRHPIMTGIFIGIWFTPVMTLGHLVFALGMSAYILIGVAHEERDLLAAFGEKYRSYMSHTSKFFPGFARKPQAPVATLKTQA